MYQLLTRNSSVCRVNPCHQHRSSLSPRRSLSHSYASRSSCFTSFNDLTPFLMPRDSLLPRDSSPDPGKLGSGLAPSSRIALRRSSTHTGIARQRNGIYVPRGSGSVDSTNGEETDPFVAIPFPCAVSGKHVPSPSSLNTPPSQSDSVERTSSNERGASTRSILGTGSGLDAASGSMHAAVPCGRFQSEVDGVSSRRRPRPNSYDKFSAKPRRLRFESMVNLSVALGENARASDLMARHVTAGSS